METQKIVYAKSQPPQTLKEHTELLLKNLEILKKTYGQKIESRVPDKFKKDFWEILQLVIIYHDLGKVFTGFQNKIRKQLDEKPLPSNINFDYIPHEVLSPAFFSRSILEKYCDEVKKAIIQAILYHHERDGMVDFVKVEKVIEKDLEKRKYLVSDIIEVPEKLWKGYERFYGDRNRIRKSDEIYPLYLLIKGLLHRIDHSSSALVEVELVKSDLPDKVVNFIYYKKKSTLKDIQTFAKNNSDKNLIIVGSTGIGKTEAGLLWVGSEKGFFTLPLRVLVNSIFDRVHKEIGYDCSGLLHSSSLEYLFYEGNETPFEIYKNSRQLSYQLIITTIDQLFTFPFKYGGYEKILSTLSYSKVIIDEIQAYEPRIAAVILKGLEELDKLGGKFLIMTATMPQIYIDYLKNKGVKFEYGVFLANKKRHLMKIENRGILDSVNHIAQMAGNKRVLVIVNTIRRAKEVYRYFMEKGIKPKLLHSLFIQRDRKKLESEIMEFTEKNEPGVWITTQIVEASLDVDFDILFTELSSADSLFQRMGRVYRKREYINDDANVFVFTEDCSGIDNIYNKDIFALSKSFLSEFDGRYINEEDKVKIVRDLYSKDNLNGTKYLEEFENALDILKNLREYELKKNEAHYIMRKIDTIKTIPFEIYQKHEEELKDNIEILKKSKCKEEKLKAELFINDLTVDVPFWKIRNCSLSQLDRFLKGISIINCKYSSEEGLLLEEALDNIF
ncbi:MAG: CRISPR-associated helicase Cas3' [Caldimicrobium sp.]